MERVRLLERPESTRVKLDADVSLRTTYEAETVKVLSDGEPIRVLVAEAKRVPCDGVFATAVLSPTRLLAVMYWARYIHFGKPLVLCDYEVGPLLADSWDKVRDNLARWMKERSSRLPYPAGFYVENPGIAAQATAAGVAARPIPPWLVTTESWNQIVQSAAGILSQGLVGVTATASDRMRQRPFISESGVASGPRDSERPEIAAYLYGIIIALDPVAASDPKPRPAVRTPRS